MVDRKGNITSAITMPMGITYLATFLKQRGLEVNFIDSPGEGIEQLKPYKREYLLRGLDIKGILKRIHKDTDLIAISAIFSPQNHIIIELIKQIKACLKVPIVLGGCHSSFNLNLFFREGADFIILGEGEHALHQLCQHLAGKIPIRQVNNLAYVRKNKIIKTQKKHYENIDELPFPDRNFLNLKNYHKLNMGHSPSNDKFTPLITSRGCPFDCTFCASAVFWEKRWKARSPKNVVDEIEMCVKKLSIREFHFEDDNMTLHKKRAELIFREIIKRGLKIKWSAASGLRPELINAKLLQLMKRSGCVHITVAPESGSPRVLKQIYKKNIDLDKIIKIVNISNKLNIKTAGYILICPLGTTREDDMQTLKYVQQLAKKGLDELGVFPVIPYPATEIAKMFEFYFKEDFDQWEELITGRIPDWYPNKKKVIEFRTKLYRTFLTYQLAYHPVKIINIVKNFMLSRQSIKTDRILQSVFKQFIRKIFS